MQVLQNPHPRMPISMNTRHTQDLNKLADIFKTVAHLLQQQKISNSDGEDDAEIPKVADPDMLKTAT